MAVAIITGAAGLIGSEAAAFFSEQGLEVVGIDNDMRRHFFGDEGARRREDGRSRSGCAATVTSTRISATRTRWSECSPTTGKRSSS